MPFCEDVQESGAYSYRTGRLKLVPTRYAALGALTGSQPHAPGTPEERHDAAADVPRPPNSAGRDADQ
jgi:hypothetical protein